MTMTLQEISDRFEIQELFVDYTQAIDRRNWDALDDVFTPDAHIDYDVDRRERRRSPVHEGVPRAGDADVQELPAPGGHEQDRGRR